MDNEENPFDMVMSDEDTLHLYMEPSTIGEALEDFFKKLEVIPPDARLDKIQLPIGVNEDGVIPVTVTLKKEAKRLN